MPLDPMVNVLRTKFSDIVENVRQLKDAATKANGPLPKVVPDSIPPTEEAPKRANEATIKGKNIMVVPHPGHFQLVLVAMEELGRMWDKQIEEEQKKPGGNG